MDDAHIGLTELTKDRAQYAMISILSIGILLFYKNDVFKIKNHGLHE